MPATFVAAPKGYRPWDHHGSASHTAVVLATRDHVSTDECLLCQPDVSPALAAIEWLVSHTSHPARIGHIPDVCSASDGWKAPDQSSAHPGSSLATCRTPGLLRIHWLSLQSCAVRDEHPAFCLRFGNRVDNSPVVLSFRAMASMVHRYCQCDVS